MASPGMEPRLIQTGLSVVIGLTLRPPREPAVWCAGGTPSSGE
jgi:hypothetical protein